MLAWCFDLYPTYYMSTCYLERTNTGGVRVLCNPTCSLPRVSRPAIPREYLTHIISLPHPMLIPVDSLFLTSTNTVGPGHEFFIASCSLPRGILAQTIYSWAFY
ncbi:hypothetical protein RJT34_02227 [Clitoria ternatea]|uniref:Uncharacterized protein n=1 Tax=Clitoria ternatea TaxID=43366 RepID=A0AAN9Q1L2_CLITE